MDNTFDARREEKLYKIKPMQLESVAGGIYQRLENSLQHRKNTRRTSFDLNRNISQASPEPIAKGNLKIPERRLLKLELWKVEKEKKKMNLKKKKPFIASVAHQIHPLKYVPPPPVHPVPSTSGRVTRSQSTRNKKDEIKPAQSQSFAPENAEFRAPKIKKMSKLPKLAPPKGKKEVAAAYTFDPVVPAPKPALMQTGSQVEIEAKSKQHNNKANNTKQTMQSSSSGSNVVGKEIARKEMNKRRLFLFEDDGTDMRNIEYFQRQLSSEIKRISDMCNVWENLSEKMPLPDFVQELVLGAVGQARLLMSQKMQQFGSLVQRCRCPDPGAPLVTPADLQGFWDMMFFQVVNVDMQFKNLEELRERNWAEDEHAATSSRRPRAPVLARRAHPAPSAPARRAENAPSAPARRTKTAPSAPACRAQPAPSAPARRAQPAPSAPARRAQPAPSAPARRAQPAPSAPARSNGLRDAIAAARKANTQQQIQPPEEKTFEAGFFSVRTPVQRDTTNLMKTQNVKKKNSYLFLNNLIE